MVALLSFIFNSQAIALTQDSQKILNNYHNYEQSGSPPATSQPYSPNDSPPEVNVVPTPKTNVISPTTTQPYYSPTSQPQSQNLSQNNGGAGWIVGAIIVTIIIAAIVKSLSKPKYENYSQKSVQRRGWTELEKEQVRINQDGKCNKCGRPPPRWEYHHRDGNRNNNSLRNCEGLCPNCHSVKTHDE